MTSLRIFTAHPIFVGDQIEKNEMGGVCSAYGGGERRVQGRRKTSWENNIKIDIKEVGFGVMDWIELAQDRNRWRALLNAVNQEKFSYNMELEWLDLERNNITDIQSSAVRNISALQHFDVAHNNINCVQSDTFQHNVELQLLDLQSNRITDIDPSTFRHHPKLIALYISNNAIRCIKQDTFIHNRKLERINLANNSISDIHMLTFRNNAKLVLLDNSEKQY